MQPVRIVALTHEEIVHASNIAVSRNETGTPSIRPDSGFDPIHIDMVGAMAEIAVCRYYGEDYKRWVTVHKTRPGAIPDIVYRGYRVSVKGRDRWDLPLDLVVPEHDTLNDIYILVSVDVEEFVCGLRGWITREELLQYPPQEWTWTTNRPGANKPGKKRRYIPCENLHPCRT